MKSHQLDESKLQVFSSSNVKQLINYFLNVTQISPLNLE